MIFKELDFFAEESELGVFGLVGFLEGLDVGLELEDFVEQVRGGRELGHY